MGRSKEEEDYDKRHIFLSYFYLYNKRRDTLRGVAASQSSILEITLTKKCGIVAQRLRQRPYCSDIAGSNLGSGVG